MKNATCLLALLFLCSCSFLMTGPKLKEKNNRYYLTPPSINAECKLRFNGIYVTESSQTNVYHLIQFYKDGKMLNAASPLEELRFDSSKGIANDGMSFYWTDCDSIKYHHQTHYGYKEFGDGRIEINGDLLFSCQIYTHENFLMTVSRRYRFIQFSK